MRQATSPDTVSGIFAAYWTPRIAHGVSPDLPDTDAWELRDPVRAGAPTMAALAARFGVSQTIVWKAVRRRSYERPRQPGHRRPRQLTDDDRRGVLAAYREGVPVVVIAEVFRISRGSVRGLAKAAGLPPRRGRAGVPPGITAATYLARLKESRCRTS